MLVVPSTSIRIRDLKIRLASINDATPIRELRLEALSLHPEAFAADFEMTKAESVDRWAKRIAEYAADKTSTISIAESQGVLVGMAGIGRGHWPKTHHLGTLWGVYVRQDWRGNSIGEQMVDKCLEWAEENGISVVKLGVITSNSPAICCYSKCGFRVYGIEPKTICHQGVFYDELLMVKTLDIP